MITNITGKRNVNI